MRRFLVFAASGGLLLFLIGLIALRYSPFDAQVAWRLNELRAQVKYWIAPPERAIFIPQQNVSISPQRETQAIPPTEAKGSSTPEHKLESPTPTLVPVQTPTPSPTPTSLPAQIELRGVRHEYQTWNNCGPATLAMALSFWGWDGDQKQVAAFTKPNPRDKNVMPYEMVNYVETQTGFGIFSRSGGDLDLLKSFLAAGFPVIVEKGFEEVSFEGWMGHYELLTGYDDQAENFTAQDSYMGPDIKVPYAQVESQWRAFNNTYLVVFPLEKKSEAESLLGPQADLAVSNQKAADQALEDVENFSGRDLFFAWFNSGTSLVAIQDYAGAAAAFDQAFSLYPDIPETERPWRMLWYQTGPYWAYFYSERYQDVINLATKTLENMSEPVLEESFYWRGMAREATGDPFGARSDFQSAIEVHPGFEPALQQLQRLKGVP